MSVTLHWWMTVPAAITIFWLGCALLENDRDMLRFCLIGRLGMIAPALLVAWLK